MAPPLPAGPRRALIVAATAYRDEALRQLRSPAHDAAELGAVLADAGGFEVQALTDASAGDVRGAIADFTAACGRDDLALVYLSCHGLLDNRRRLWFAAADTVKAKMVATGVEATWLMDRMADCRARQQVVVLDCCFSGAFAQGAKGDDDAALESQLKARGTVVLTASGATEYSFEGDPLTDAPQGSVFTAAFVDGLRTGAADTDNDGFISVDEAYAYAHDRVVATATGQTPQRWSFAAEGRIILARNPAGMRVTPARIPTDLRTLLDHPRPGIRAAALDTLAEWLAGDEPAQILAARAELRRIATEDLPSIGDKARALLGERPPTEAAEQTAHEIVEEARREAKRIHADAERLAADAQERAEVAAVLLDQAQAEAAALVEEARRKADEIRAAAPGGRQDLAGIRLLWVDDNPGSNEHLARNFTARGAVVYPAMTTNQAVQFLGQMGFDALISDISRDGREVGFDDLTRLRAAGYAGPAVFFTARTTPELRNRAKKSDAEGIVSSADELSDWLRKVRATAAPREPQSGFFARMREAFNDS
ncbi:caspase family protein [Asanoa sp. NPDC049573]|uniref:caspase, EACC1-associated type n=1 Tax=Asanoa sp. NPDC049573 TaxID=3155396 RepID=UPI00343327BE